MTSSSSTGRNPSAAPKIAFTSPVAYGPPQHPLDDMTSAEQLRMLPLNLIN
jgi:hypothetical protein